MFTKCKIKRHEMPQPEWLPDRLKTGVPNIFVQQKTVFVQYSLSKHAVLSEFAEQALNKN